MANTQKGNNGAHSLVNGGKSNQGRKRKDSSNLKYTCLYHRQNNTHNTDDCKVMLKQASSMASAHAGRGGKHKKWSRSDDQEKKDKKKVQYQSFVADVAKHLKKKQKTHKESSFNDTEEILNMEEFNFDKFQVRDNEDDSDESSKDIKYESD